MRKLPVLYLVLSLSGSLAALEGQTQLSCENVYGKRGSPPLLKAHISRDDRLHDLKLNTADEAFREYHEDRQLASPAEGHVEGRAVTGQDNPFYGNQDFLLKLGDYMARLILPTDLSADSLSSAVVGRHTRPRSNAVLLVEAPSRHGHGASDTLVRLYCMSR